ncbi:MAG: DMT family transporter [Alphaproteobacteria bacterium]|nr:DMT family transporter [Alphaproteobacteria bacterium]
MNTPKKDQIYKGIIYACISFFMFTVQNAMAKLLLPFHDAIEVVFYRNLICFVPCLIYVLVLRKYYLFKTSMPGTLFVRVFIGMIGTVLTIAASQYLPLSDATVIFFMSTLLIPVLAHFYLKERIGLHRWLAVGIGMSGVILVAQPSGDVTLFGISLALGAACVHASIQVLIRAMKSENPFTITFYFFLMGLLGPALAMPWVANTLLIENIPILLGVGLSGGLGQYFLTRGFQMAPASLLGPFNYTGLIWATGLDILIWHYVPGWPVFVGGAVIILSKFYILYRERVTSEKK